MSGELSVETLTDPDGTRVVIMKEELANTRALMELVDRLPILQPEGAFLKKLRVGGRRRGQRLSLVLVFEFYERAEAEVMATGETAESPAPLRG